MRGLEPILTAIQVQFYNNPSCQLQASGFNYADWVNAFKTTEIVVTLPANVRATDGDGFGFVESVKEVKDLVGRKVVEPNVTGKVVLRFGDATAGEVTPSEPKGDYLVENYSQGLRKLLDAL
ncbi:hypothetical protein BC829DRAFT_388915 [Chytridium lagenaria]|nr:hypothetical protein BC829DRAFT_388915 [Chytridium lagenaria]